MALWRESSAAGFQKDMKSYNTAMEDENIRAIAEKGCCDEIWKKKPIVLSGVKNNFDQFFTKSSKQPNRKEYHEMYFSHEARNRNQRHSGTETPKS